MNANRWHRIGANENNSPREPRTISTQPQNMCVTYSVSKLHFIWPLRTPLHFFGGFRYVCMCFFSLPFASFPSFFFNLNKVARVQANYFGCYAITFALEYGSPSIIWGGETWMEDALNDIGFNIYLAWKRADAVWVPRDIHFHFHSSISSFYLVLSHVSMRAATIYRTYTPSHPHPPPPSPLCSNQMLRYSNHQCFKHNNHKQAMEPLADIASTPPLFGVTLWLCVDQKYKMGKKRRKTVSSCHRITHTTSYLSTLLEMKTTKNKCI